MSWNADTDLLTVVGVTLISMISGFISISQRIVRGAAVTVLWVVSEFLAALLCGYLMWDAYPKLAPKLPDWCTLWLTVALASHGGARFLQTVERNFYKRLRIDEAP